MSQLYERRVSRLGYRSNASIFYDRGDPWVSEREGLRDFGRNLMTENPDFDRYFAKSPSKEDGEKIEKAKPREGRRDDIHLRKAQARMRAKAAVKESENSKPISVEGFAPGYFKR